MTFLNAGTSVPGRILCCVALVICSTTAYGQASIQNFTMRPFVTSITPVIGRGGGVGGVMVDAGGVVARSNAADDKALRAGWLRAHGPIGEDVGQATAMRMISLSRLDRALEKRIGQQKQPTEEMFYLAGLERVQYVFVVPEQNDVVIAGPAGRWQASDDGTVVSAKTGMPVVRLDDLIDALRTDPSVREHGITCSIEPTEAGLKRYARLTSRPITFSKAAVSAMEKSLGPQQILVGGISSESRFARIMVAADYRMKRLAMGFERSPLEGMPGYLELLRRNPGATRITSPRWWMTTDYQPLLRSSDRLAWQIRGNGVKTLTEDSILDARGNRSVPAEPNPLAQRWAETMTLAYERLSVAAPVFGQLRNCMDLAVLSALISNEGFLTVADCRWEVLLDPQRLKTPKYEVPKAVPSKGSMVKGQNGWIVSVSGGVEIDPFGVVQRTQVDHGLAATYQKATSAAPADRWWW